jgi:hypothetical protein
MSEKIGYIFLLNELPSDHQVRGQQSWCRAYLVSDKWVNTVLTDGMPTFDMPHERAT